MHFTKILADEIQAKTRNYRSGTLYSALEGSNECTGDPAWRIVGDLPEFNDQKIEA